MQWRLPEDGYEWWVVIHLFAAAVAGGLLTLLGV